MVDKFYFIICLSFLCFLCIWFGWYIGVEDMKKKYRKEQEQKNDCE